ncbi:flagellar assembly protein T N-terminal domain-containing protein [Parashewanella tropica]|uniref:flagellar assembly protein T N-terminal domain-containing protein n=1 Tax=Parashewanella tropica TaxID=2547970 RepID=UPI0010598802|nr:flagellar assembly protein T N-terminal domain-containing protein [Parashewanella tropica]
MVMLHRAFVFLFLVFGFLPVTQPADFYFQGQAQIIDGDINSARQQAIEAALLTANLENGITINSSRESTNSQFHQSHTILNNRLDGEQVELISERIQKDIIVVNVKISSHQSHFQTAGKVSIFLPQLNLTNPAHLRYGQLSGFQQSLTEELSDSLAQKSKLSFPELRADQNLNLSQSFFEDNTQKLPNWIGDMSNSQYVLIGNILNAEVVPAPKSFWDFVEHYPSRQFQINLNLFHAISGEKIWQKTYFINEVWEFERNKILSASSTELWHSKYGQAIKRLLNSIALEIDTQLKERPLMGTFIVKHEKQLLINLGRRNNIQVGDKLKLVLRKDLHTRFQSIKTIAQPSHTELTVTQITEQTAVVEWSKATEIENIQVGDVVIKP